MMVPYIQRVQENGVAACVKHFALNNEEVHRHSVDVQVSDRAWYEIYLPAFKSAVQEGRAWAVMGAYNLYKGQHCCHNQYLSQSLLYPGMPCPCLGWIIGAIVQGLVLGNRKGKEVVQLYVITFSVERPYKELKSFRKISLASGEEKTVEFTVTAADLKYFDQARHDWVAEPGKFELLVSDSQANVNIYDFVFVRSIFFMESLLLFEFIQARGATVRPEV